VRRALDDDVASQVGRLRPSIAALQPLQRMPLALLALPALKSLPPERLRTTRQAVQTLIHADGAVDAFEYALGAMLDAQLGDALKPLAAKPKPAVTLALLRDEIALVLGVLAQTGHADDRPAEAAFRRGIETALGVSVAWQRRVDWSRELDRALRHLDQLTPPRKAQLVHALAQTVIHDGRVTVDEYELLRAVCASLHCPLPLLLQK
jgi:hypothetical protein